ncbi:MAG TPA: glycosyltransferase family 4 protein [Thermoanaerobaculia bacterium]|nr:glycosyltransferase family 4 protein [Thermoanaerobaculia bacterium]
MIGAASRPSIALVSSEPLRAVMAGIGIRYVEIARHLAREGLSVALVHPGPLADTPDAGPGVEPRLFRRGGLASVLGDCGAVVAQGQLANDVALELPSTPLAIDLYDPWLVENLHYAESLGLDPYRNDLRSWVLQLARGDFFLCASEEQRDFYLGFLTALGRVNPQRLQLDPDLRRLIDVVPFGVPDELPPHRPWLEAAAPGDALLLFGGVYEWYDPWTLLEALDTLRDLRWRLVFARNPNAASTPQRLLGRVLQWTSDRGAAWRDRVDLVDWVPYERRFDLLRDVRLLVSTHGDGLEMRLSLRTRFLDAMAAGCPVVTSEGGAVARLVRESGAGWVVPRGDAAALARALREALEAPDAARARGEAARNAARSMSWSKVLAPLERFCRDPLGDPTREQFAWRPEAPIPEDGWRFRVRRGLRSLLAHRGRGRGGAAHGGGSGRRERRAGRAS